MKMKNTMRGYDMLFLFGLFVALASFFFLSSLIGICIGLALQIASLGWEITVLRKAFNEQERKEGQL